MTKKMKYWLIGGGVVALAAGGAYYYHQKHLPPTPSNPQLVPVTTFVNGLSYRFAALLPAGISDTATLESALKAAGWSNVKIDFFAGSGNKGSFPIADTGYVAEGKWSGPGGTAVTPGVVAIQL